MYFRSFEAPSNDQFFDDEFQWIVNTSGVCSTATFNLSKTLSYQRRTGHEKYFCKMKCKRVQSVTNLKAIPFWMELSLWIKHGYILWSKDKIAINRSSKPKKFSLKMLLKKFLFQSSEIVVVTFSLITWTRKKP